MSRIDVDVCLRCPTYATWCVLGCEPHRMENVMQSKRRGATLIELIIVVLILGILGLIVHNQFYQVYSADEGRCPAECEAIRPLCGGMTPTYKGIEDGWVCPTTPNYLD